MVRELPALLAQQALAPSNTASAESIPQEPRKLYRAENDKVLGGVCAGLAHYLRIDPAVVRIIFTLDHFWWFWVWNPALYSAVDRASFQSHS